MTRFKAGMAVAGSVSALALILSGCSLDDAKNKASEAQEKAASAAVNALPSAPDPETAKQVSCTALDLMTKMDEKHQRKMIGVMRTLNEKIAPQAGDPRLREVADQVAGVADSGVGVRSDAQRQMIRAACK